MHRIPKLRSSAWQKQAHVEEYRKACAAVYTRLSKPSITAPTKTADRSVATEKRRPARTSIYSSRLLRPRSRKTADLRVAATLFCQSWKRVLGFQNTIWVDYECLRGVARVTLLMRAQKHHMLDLPRARIASGTSTGVLQPSRVTFLVGDAAAGRDAGRL